MTCLRNIATLFFAKLAYIALFLSGWKKKIVEANLKHVSQGTAEKKRNVGPESWIANLEPHKLYNDMLKNLVRHVGELLFCFDTYKKLPADCGAYPHHAAGCHFELADGTATVIKKMRMGGIFLTAHYGNYEASGAWLCALGVPVKASFIPLKPAWLNRFVYKNIRSVRGRPYSMEARTPRDFLQVLDRGEVFCLLADQDSRIPSALDGTYFGKSVKVNPLPDFLLKYRPDASVYFCWIEELDKGKCRKVLHAVDALRDNKGIVNGEYREWLEKRIAENPALWYGWTHRRFRSINPEIYNSK